MRRSFIKLTRWLPCILLALGSYAHAQEGQTGQVDIKSIFETPKAIVDAAGKPVLTRLGAGHPNIYDWNGDGKMDIIWGGKRGMFGKGGKILFLKNTGSNESPTFEVAEAVPLHLEGREQFFSVSCGCATGGSFEVHPRDWNGDGNVDLFVNTRSAARWGAFVLINNAKSLEKPEFTFDRKTVLTIRGHGYGSGGGDWNNDGLMDYAHQVNGHGWKIHLGTLDTEGRERITLGACIRSNEYKMIGHDQYAAVRDQPRWFDNMAYAWNFSGTHPPGEQPLDITTHECGSCRHKIKPMMGSRIVELVASMNAGDKDSPLSELNYYWLDHVKKTCIFKGRIAAHKARSTRLSVGDLNRDGRMDLIYAGGVGGKGDDTQIHVAYGKVKNIFKRPAWLKPAEPTTRSSKVEAQVEDATPKVDVKALFGEPKALVDAGGKEIVTRRATGHAVVFDWSGDGLNDIILGCYVDMSGKGSEIRFIRNVGSKKEPRFDWANAYGMKEIRFEGKEEPYVMDVAHRGSATLEVHPCDMDQDGTWDLVVSSGKHRGLDCFLLPGKGLKDGKPVFGFWQRLHNIVRGQPQGSGGGDWNGDGVVDFAHRCNFQEWQVHFGTKKNGHSSFDIASNLASTQYRKTGHKTWFHRTPYAWSFSGEHPARKDTVMKIGSTCRFCDGAMEAKLFQPFTEVVASMDIHDKSQEPVKGRYPLKGSAIQLFRIDHRHGTSTHTGTLAETDQHVARISIGDLNHDGSMDIVFTGGLSEAGDETKIYVIYGKIRNIR